jgi:hypothetical protein
MSGDHVPIERPVGVLGVELAAIFATKYAKGSVLIVLIGAAERSFCCRL